MSDHNCEVCGSGPLIDGVTIHRANKLGELPSKWRCKKHLHREIDAEVEHICNVLESGDK